MELDKVEDERQTHAVVLAAVSAYMTADQTPEGSKEAPNHWRDVARIEACGLAVSDRRHPRPRRTGL